MARTRLRLTPLESRECPSVAVATYDSGSTVRISGDAAADHVTVSQNDATDTLTVSWGSGSQTFRSSTVKMILIDLKGGDDTLQYVVQGDRFTNSKDIRVDLGQGNDSANFDFTGNQNQIHLRADLRAIVQAGDGNDSVQANFGTIENRAKVTFRTYLGAGDDSASLAMHGALIEQSRTSIDLEGGTGNDRLSVNAQDVAIATQSDLNIWQTGGDGNDRMEVAYSGALQGSLMTRIDAGNGNDVVDVEYVVDYLSTGTASAGLVGGLGNDEIRLGMWRGLPPGNVSPPLWRLFGSVSGGEGTDVGRTSAKVTVSGCEELDGLVSIGG